MPVLQTTRLLIRPFVLEDLPAIHRILDLELGYSVAEPGQDVLAARREWLEWSVRNYAALAALYQPPYGDRAVVLRATGAVIGATGLAPALGPWEQLPGWGAEPPASRSRLFMPAVGLFWAIAPAHQRQGYAAEAGRALIDYAFSAMRLQRIVATTEHDNLASQGVMRKLGMRLLSNPLPAPPWLQVVGILDVPNISEAP